MTTAGFHHEGPTSRGLSERHWRRVVTMQPYAAQPATCPTNRGRGAGSAAYGMGVWTSPGDELHLEALGALEVGGVVVRPTREGVTVGEHQRPPTLVAVGDDGLDVAS